MKTNHLFLIKTLVFFNILETEIENNFSKYGMLNTKSYIYYKYNNLKKDIYRPCHKYQFYDDKDALSYEIILNNYNFGTANFDNNIFILMILFMSKLKTIVIK